MKSGKKSNFNSGFTFVELLIVIAILLILFSVIVMNYATYTEKGRETADVSNTKKVEEAINIFLASGEFYPGIRVSYNIHTGAIMVRYPERPYENNDYMSYKILNQMDAQDDDNDPTNGVPDLIAKSKNALGMLDRYGEPLDNIIWHIEENHKGQVIVYSEVSVYNVLEYDEIPDISSVSFDYTVWLS